MNYPAITSVFNFSEYFCLILNTCKES